MSEYVGGSVAFWLTTYSLLQQLKMDAGHLSRQDVEAKLAAYETLYNDQRKALLKSGHDESKPGAPGTTMTLPSDLKNYADTTLLEGQIHDQFKDDTRFMQLRSEILANVGRRSN